MKAWKWKGFYGINIYFFNCSYTSKINTIEVNTKSSAEYAEELC